MRCGGMDEIFCANFMVFDDVVREEPFDVWIADEAWEVDHFLHENPELKTAPFAWLTDFVGYLPMPAGGEREAFLTADYNAEMIEHVERYPEHPRPGDLHRRRRATWSPGRFGPRAARRSASGRSATTASRGYVPGFDPRTVADRAALCARSSATATSRCCLVSVGGSGVGAPLLRRVIEALPLARERVPGLRTVAVAGTADRSGEPARRPRASRCSATSTSCTAISPPATSPSCRAG